MCSGLKCASKSATLIRAWFQSLTHYVRNRTLVLGKWSVPGWCKVMWSNTKQKDSVTFPNWLLSNNSMSQKCFIQLIPQHFDDADITFDFFIFFKQWHVRCFYTDYSSAWGGTSIKEVRSCYHFHSSRNTLLMRHQALCLNFFSYVFEKLPSRNPLSCWKPWKFYSLQYYSWLL